jgi:hypothetical protein
MKEMKQAKMQWKQDPSQSNVDNLNNVRCAASRNFKNKQKTYFKAKIEELETNSKINNIRDLYRGINSVKKGNQPRTRIAKDEKGCRLPQHYGEVEETFSNGQTPLSTL